jgi:hypothetical protein
VTLSEQPAHVQSVHPRRKLGALPPDSTKPRLYLARYTASELVAAVPNGIDYLSHIPTWGMYDNDTIGDATAAAAAHIEAVWSSYGQGQSASVPEAAVLDFYSACSGYLTRFPATDQGARLQDVLKHWRRAPGLGGRTIAAFFAVDPGNEEMVRAALYLFGALYVGVVLPRVAHTQCDAGQPWDVVDDDGGEDGGHCVHLGAASRTGNYKVTTWGQVQEITPAWWRRYVVEAWAPVSTTWVRAGLSPAGLDAETLNRDFTALTGEPGPFPPSVIPPRLASAPPAEPTEATGPPSGPTSPIAAPPVPSPRDGPDDDPEWEADLDLADELRRWLGHHQWSRVSRSLASMAVSWLRARNL